MHRHRHLSALNRESCIPARRQPLSVGENRSRPNIRAQSAFGQRESSYPFSYETNQKDCISDFYVESVNRDVLRQGSASSLVQSRVRPDRALRGLSAPAERSEQQIEEGRKAPAVCLFPNKESRFAEFNPNIFKASRDDLRMPTVELKRWLEDLQLEVAE